MTQAPTDALRLVPIDMQIESILHDLVEEVSAAQRGARVKARARQCCARGAAKNALINLLAAAPASPLPGGGPYEKVPVKRKLEAGAALRDRLKAVGDGLGSQVVADLVGSLRASHQNSAALFAQLNHARGLLKPFAAMADAGDQRPKDDAVWAGQDGLRITYGDFRAARAFLARNGKGEG